MIRFLEQCRLPSELTDLLANLHSHQTPSDRLSPNTQWQLFILDLSHYLIAMINPELTPHPDMHIEPLNQLLTNLDINNQMLDDLKQVIEEQITAN
jgi:hypothetical protein